MCVTYTERNVPIGNFMLLLNQQGSDSLSNDIRLLAREKRPKANNRRQRRRQRRRNNDIDRLHKELYTQQDRVLQLRLIMLKMNKAQHQSTSSSNPAQKGLLVISSLNKKLEDLKAENKKLSQ